LFPVQPPDSIRRGSDLSQGLVEFIPQRLYFLVKFHQLLMQLTEGLPVPDSILIGRVQLIQESPYFRLLLLKPPAQWSCDGFDCLINIPLLLNLATDNLKLVDFWLFREVLGEGLKP